MAESLVQPLGTCRCKPEGQQTFKYMCWDVSKCKAANAFFCQMCRSDHDNHAHENLQMASEFNKKLRRLTQYEQLLSQFQNQLQNQLSKNQRTIKAALKAKNRLIQASGVLSDESSIDATEFVRIFKERDFQRGILASKCKSFRDFVLSINYKELSGCISHMKKAIERVQQPNYLEDLITKIFTFESGSKEMYNQIKMDLTPIVERAMESRVDGIKKMLSSIQWKPPTMPRESQSILLQSKDYSRVSTMIPDISQIISELDQLVGNGKQSRRASQGTDEFDVGQNNLVQKLNCKILVGKDKQPAEAATFTSTSFPQSGILSDVINAKPADRKKSKRPPLETMSQLQRRPSTQFKSSELETYLSGQIKTKIGPMGIFATVEDKNRMLKEMSDLKGNFCELFLNGSAAARWEAMKSIDICSTTKIIRLSRNKFVDVGILAEVSLKNIKYLHLNDNLIDNLNQFEQIDFKNLQVLSLDNNQIKDLTPLSLINLRSLQVLSMNSNCIDSLDGLEDVNFRNLQGLALSSNQIEDPKPLKSLDYKNMFWVELKNNPFNEDSIDWIKKLNVKNKSGSKICIYV